MKLFPQGLRHGWKFFWKYELSQLPYNIKYMIKEEINKYKRIRNAEKNLFEKMLNAGNEWDIACIKCQHCCDSRDEEYCDYWDVELEGNYDDWGNRDGVKRCKECADSESYEDKSDVKDIRIWAYHMARGHMYKWNSKKKKCEWVKEKKHG